MFDRRANQILWRRIATNYLVHHRHVRRFERVAQFDEITQFVLGALIKFEIFGDATKSAELAANLQVGNLAAQLSSQLSQTFKMNITAQVSGGKVAATSEKWPEGEEWEEVDGQYILRHCPQGFLLVNTTVELSMCRECNAGTYSFSDSDACNEQVHPAICDVRDCSSCPVGATCAKGSEETDRHFVPKAVKVFASACILAYTYVHAYLYIFMHMYAYRHIHLLCIYTCTYAHEQYVHTHTHT